MDKYNRVVVLSRLPFQPQLFRVYEVSLDLGEEYGKVYLCEYIVSISHKDGTEVRNKIRYAIELL